MRISEWRRTCSLAVIFALTSEKTTDEAVQVWQRADADPFEQIMLAVHALAVDAPAVRARGARARGGRACGARPAVDARAPNRRWWRSATASPPLPLLPSPPRIVPPMIVPRMPPPPMPMPPQPSSGPASSSAELGRHAAATLNTARSTVNDAADRLAETC